MSQRPWFDFWLRRYILFACSYRPVILFFFAFPYLSFPLRIDPFRFQAGCRKERLNPALVFVFILCCSTFPLTVDACFCCARFSSFHTKPIREICLGKRLRNDLICKTTTQSIKSRRSICDRCRLLRGRLVIPESPRWLAVNRRYEEVTELLGKICSINGLKLPDDFNPADLADMVRSRSSLQYLLRWRSQEGGRGHAPEIGFTRKFLAVPLS